MSLPLQLLIENAFWLNERKVILYFNKDVTDLESIGEFYFDGVGKKSSELTYANYTVFGERSGYFIERGQGEVTFLADPQTGVNIEEQEDVYVAGSFNQWGKKPWKMKLEKLEGKPFYIYRAKKDEVPEHAVFKFVTSKGEWFPVRANAFNASKDASGNVNHSFSLIQTGSHCLQFKTQVACDFRKKHQISLNKQTLFIEDELLLYTVDSKKCLGASVGFFTTTFRLYAPRATQVFVKYYKKLEDNEKKLELKIKKDCVWEGSVWKKLSGYYYHYQVIGDNTSNKTHFDPEVKILDPYAKAAVSPSGPGIILKSSKKTKSNFTIPSLKDLVIIEAHIRDLLKHCPLALTQEEKLGFSGLTKWLKSGEHYFKHIGVNAVELQPIHEFSYEQSQEYHWGYMPVNYFSPSSAYAKTPKSASQIEEFKALVEAFHEEGIAVIIDVVYNHLGEPNGLFYIDKSYYFETNLEGYLMNYSGCGNDIHAKAPMVRKLILDSLRYMIEVFGVDGFRFDLGELLGVELFKQIENELRPLKPDVLLIAEPWSFRGHIAYSLKKTSISSWNDGYRKFIEEYVLGKSNQEAFRYFIAGSTGFLSSFPAQSINYPASHDDLCWIDKITENPARQGQVPTVNDMKRTHLMVALLMVSLGVPMLTAGQDFLHSKQGLNNTYQLGEINALKYENIEKFVQTHVYFKSWIAFRRSPIGKLIRLEHNPNEGYFKFSFLPGFSCATVLFNADYSQGNNQLLFAINPHLENMTIFLDKNEINLNLFKKVATETIFNENGLYEPLKLNEQKITMAPLSVGLWVLEK